MLSPSERNKLVGILGRLGSDFDGERAAAGLLATQMLRRLGMGWDAVVTDQPVTVRQAETGPSNHTPTSWSESLALCRRHLNWLNKWESEFVGSLSDRHGLPSAKQLQVLARITDKLVRSGAV